MGWLYDFIYTVLYPVEWLISWILYLFHKLFVLIGFSDGPGFAWVLSIICLTLFVQALVFPLFYRQIISMRKQQALQPKLMKIQKKYKGKKDPASREAQSREIMKLYKESGTNPLAAIGPMFLQAPVFMSLFYVLREVQVVAAGQKDSIGPITQTIAQSIQHTEFIGVKLSSSFSGVSFAGALESSTASTQGRIIIAICIAYMCATLFYMQFHNIRHNTPTEMAGTQQVKMQRTMMYFFPLMYIFSGVALPFAFLLYWMTNNTCNLIRTFWQVRNFPTPGSPAHERKVKRDHDNENKRRAAQGQPSIEEQELIDAKANAELKVANGSFQREQPRRKKPKKK